jgi:hypothetical protein
MQKIIAKRGPADAIRNLWKEIKPHVIYDSIFLVLGVFVGLLFASGSF